MVTAAIKNVGVIMQKTTTSLMDHMGSGKEWDLAPKKKPREKNDGLYNFPARPFLPVRMWVSTTAL